MLIPCLETYKRMVGARAGIWPELVNDGSDIELAVKMGSDLVKAILKGAAATLVVAVVRISGESIRILGLKIEDDKNDPVFLQQPQEVSQDQQLFEILLTKNSSALTFFDELVRPVMEARVSWNIKDAATALDELKATLPHCQIDSNSLLGEALTRTLEDCQKWHRGEGQLNSSVWVTIPLRFEHLRTIHVSTPEAGPFNVDDVDEGGGLEKSAYAVLEANYPGTTHLNPQIDSGPKRREFCDVLVVNSDHLIILQSKVMAILDRSPDQTTPRRAANVYSNFRKALSQLNGSVRMLRQGKILYTKEGFEIPYKYSATKVLHGIVLLSSTNLSLPWPEVSQELIAASNKAQAKFHLLEFVELQQHIAFAKTLDRMNLHLCSRYETLKKSGNANIKARFVEPENRPITSAPIDDGAYGYVFTIELENGAKAYAELIFKVFTAALKKRRFTGRCEYFQDIGLLFGAKFCWVGLGILWQRPVDPMPSYDWWVDFREEIRPQLDANPGLKLTHLSEMRRLDEMRASQNLAMISEFEDGNVMGFIDPDKPESENQ